MQTDRSHRYADADARWAAVVGRDPRADDAFWFAVRTTGIYCRPSCPSRRPRRENVVFFASPRAAERAGFRACQRCTPAQASAARPLAAAIAMACRVLDADSTGARTPRFAEIARKAGYSAAHFHRAFKSAIGMTPRRYAEAARFARLRADLGGTRRVIDAIEQSGFSSSSRAYDAARRHLGTSPAAYRSGRQGAEVRFAVRRTPLGFLLVAATAAGVCAVELGDERTALVTSFLARHRDARAARADRVLAAHVDSVVAYLAAPRGGLQLPLDVAGTAFQHRVWEALIAIPPGTTTTYGELAARLGAPRAVRAVAGACAANPAALAIPCHRVVAHDGSLAGYRWGIERKARLIASERAGVGTPPAAGAPPRGARR
jgi:AraC family transcriptional regulator of adaptative response/methylated-DNA-[protein]-cysteine methyltransferase